MEAKEKKFKEIFTGENQIIVPFFQRRYQWESDRWEKLWDDLYNAYTKKYHHFVGSIIIKRQSQTSNSNQFDLIDGQQRFTTFSIMIKAIADVLGILYSDDAIKSLLFVQKRNDNDKPKPRIVHSKIDRDHFNEIMIYDEIEVPTDLKIEDKKISSIMRCYAFFKNKAKITLDNKGGDDLASFLDNIALDEKLWVEINIQDEEEAQRIFDSINTAGLPLTKFDIIKNYLLNGISEDIFKTWQEVFEHDEECVNFWDSEKIIGRLKWCHSDLLVYYYSLIEGIFDPEKDSMEQITTSLKKHINDSNRIEIIKNFCDLANIYKHLFFNRDSDMSWNMSISNRVITILEQVDNSTMIPLVLYIEKQTKDNKFDENTSCKILKHIEKYIVYRFITEDETKSYNKIVSRVLISLKKNDTSTDKVFEEILTMPNKVDVVNVIKNNGINWNVAKFLLKWIELYKQNEASRMSGQHALISNGFKFHLEHLMPQSWYEYWPLSSGINVDELLKNHNKTLDDINQNEVLRNKLLGDSIAYNNRNNAINKIGNFTLLTGSLNSSIRNYNWDRKINGDGKAKNCIKKYANFRINNELINKESWTEDDIEKRTNEFKDIVCEKLWP